MRNQEFTREITLLRQTLELAKGCADQQLAQQLKEVVPRSPFLMGNPHLSVP